MFVSNINIYLKQKQYKLQYIFDRWCTGTLDELVGSHTKLAIYPTLTICC